MVEFLLVIEFLTVVRCIKSEFQRANELLSDDNILPISSTTLELIEHKETEGSFSTERNLFVDSKKLFIVAPSLRQTQSCLQIARYKINRIRKLLRTIRQIHLELYRVSRSVSHMYGIPISLEIAMCILLNIYVLYYFYVFYEKERYNIKKVTAQFIITILYCLQYLVKIFAVNYICDKTTKEAEHTSAIIHTFYGNNTDIEIKKEVEIFSLQMMQATITYSAFGLYNLNCKHICSVVYRHYNDIHGYNNTSNRFNKKRIINLSDGPLFCQFYKLCGCYHTKLRNMFGNLIESQETELLKIISKFQFFNNDFIYMIVIFSGFTRRKRIKLFIERMEMCTRGMDELKVPENYSSLFRYQCITDVFLIFLVSGLYVGEALWLSDTKLLSKMDYNVIIMVCAITFNPVIIMIISDFTFVFWIRQIKFVQLNAVLQSMLTTSNDSPQYKRVLRMKNNWEDDSSLSTYYGTYKAYENLAKLKKVKQIHLELMKCASIINEAYGLQIFISILTSVLFITTTLYNAFVTLTTNNYYNCMIQFYTHSYWIFYCFFKVFAITNICQTTITEIREFMYQLIQNRLKFTVCGFYDLDHTLIYNAIGSIITYLVILLQVGDKPKAFFNNAIHNSTSTI
ncbi:hypothetical protein HZH68_002312 [Vespula germanica]|uniref:Gustatory receptor n=1 Tax=Vespula germanica TaxID=30212 RepID=A0A834NM60_VESGE|nr:hypothetical protein HZH68_002312 [Vespula germanica]